MPRDVALLIGSLRRDSNSQRIAHALGAVCSEQLSLRPVAIGDLPLFNQDLESAPPAPWERLRAEIRAAKAVLFVTPEYNRSIPGVLKNALDVGSRPYGHSVFNGKPAAIISSSIGGLGGFGANHHLRQSLAFLNMPTLGQPEMYLGAVQNWFAADGSLVDAGGRQLLTQFGSAFAAWIDRHEN
jgi:chromate reductase, NAD(P)H dehydrogenase (quinone)